MSIIVNTTVLSNFASIGQFVLLRRLFDQLYVSVEVFEEIEAGLEEGYGFYGEVKSAIRPFSAAGWIELTAMSGEIELKLFGSAPSKLHGGEASSIAIAKARGWLFLSDDLAARTYAASLDIEISGTLGCLALAVERKLAPLEQANHWLRQMAEAGYHSPVADLSELS